MHQSFNSTYCTRNTLRSAGSRTSRSSIEHRVGHTHHRWPWCFWIRNVMHSWECRPRNRRGRSKTHYYPRSSSQIGPPFLGGWCSTCVSSWRLVTGSPSSGWADSCRERASRRPGSSWILLGTRFPIELVNRVNMSNEPGDTKYDWPFHHTGCQRFCCRASRNPVLSRSGDTC